VYWTSLYRAKAILGQSIFRSYSRNNRNSLLMGINNQKESLIKKMLTQLFKLLNKLALQISKRLEPV